MRKIRSYRQFLSPDRPVPLVAVLEELDSKETLEEKNNQSNKKLEEKFPELLELSQEYIKLEAELREGIEGKQFEQMMDELMEVEGFKAAIGVLRKIVVKTGVVKTLKLMKVSLANMKKMMNFEKKIREILPDGEKYYVVGISTITGGEKSDVEEMLDQIKKSLTPKNLMRILTGKTDELELEYNTRKGGEASGEIQNVEIKDDGSIEVSIKNDKVGTIKKDITKITSAGDDTGDDTGEESEEIIKKLSAIKTKIPGSIQKIYKFANFISNDDNKEKTEQIDKIIET